MIFMDLNQQQNKLFMKESAEQIQSRIDYIKSKKIKDAQDTIDYYKRIGANADLSRYEDEIAEFEQDIINLEKILNGDIKKLDTIKVKVTEYKGGVVIETINPNDFDQDYLAAGQGRYACILTDNSRLAISEEAAKIIKKMGRTRDVLGTLVGSENHFAWCGGPFFLFPSDEKVCRDFKMPVGYQTIENETSQEAKDVIDSKNESSAGIEYADIKHELWIDLTRNGSHKKQEDGTTKYLYNNYFTLQVRPLDKYIHDLDTPILNAPEGKVVNSMNYEGSRRIYMSEDNLQQIKTLSKQIFKDNKSERVHEDDIMSYINGLYALGFFNNCMNPSEHYWRMSIVDTPENIIETLKKFKKA